MSYGLALSCAGLLGIEDATCDPQFDERCAETSIQPNLSDPGGAGGATMAAGGAGGSVMASGGAAASGGSPAGVGGAAGGGAGTDGEEEPATEIEEPLCERYCALVASVCTGAYEQYASPAACLAVCSRLPPGNVGDFTGNSVECRFARADLARATGEPGNYCFSAGPGGAGVCGSDCEGFCSIMALTCTLMGSYDECLPGCAQVPDLSGPPDNITYDTSQQSGDSIQCRLFHVSAATLDERTHCSHAAGVALCAE